MSLRPFTSVPTTGLRAALALAAGTMGGVAHGDIFSLYLDDGAHLYTTTGMPDFDQVRDGLPVDTKNNLPGGCFCGPTAATNLLAYIAMHGEPQVFPYLPETSWSDPGVHDDVTVFIHLFGLFANTESVTGCSTGHENMVRVLNSTGDHWIERNLDISTVAWNRSDPQSVPPRLEEFTSRLAAEQGLGLAYRGTWEGLSNGEDRFYTGLDRRRGGHYMTVQSALRAGDTARLLLRNSSDDTADPGTQSAFATVAYDVSPTELVVDGVTKTIDRLGEPFLSSGDTHLHVFYGYLIMTPKCWYGWGDGEHVLERVPGSHMPGGMGGLGGSHDFGDPIADAAFDSSGSAMAVLAGGRLHRVTPNELDGLTVEPFDLDLPESTVIAFDRDFGLHAVSGRNAHVIDWRSGSVRTTATLPSPGTAITIIDEMPHVLMPEMQAIASIAHATPGENPAITVLPLPAGVLADEHSELEMLPGGRLFLLTDGVLHPMRITPNGLEPIDRPVPRNGVWRQVARAGDATLCLSDASNRVEVYDLRPEGFVRVPDHAFDGMQAADNFHPSRSHVTLGADEEDPNYEGDSDDAGTIALDCAGDLNLDGRVDSGDMGLLLGDWGSDHSMADLNHDGQVDASDLGLMLGAFGACP